VNSTKKNFTDLVEKAHYRLALRLKEGKQKRQNGCYTDTSEKKTKSS